MDEKTIIKEILLRGYYGIDNWMLQRRFEEDLEGLTVQMNEIRGFVDRCYALLSDKFLDGKELIVEYLQMPALYEWMEEKYPHEEFEEECDWMAYSEELVYDKLSIVKRTSFYGEMPVWCDMLVVFILFLLGKKCANDNRYQKFELFSRLLEEEDLSWEFFHGFTLSENLLAEAREKLVIDPIQLLKGSRMIERTESSFDLSGKNQQEVLDDIYWYEEDGGYVEFPSIVVSIARAYRCSGKDDAFIALWKSLSHPTLQYGLLYYLSLLPKDCVELLELFQNNNIDVIGCTLVRDFWFRQTVRCLENLIQFEEKSKTGNAATMDIVSVEQLKDTYKEKLDAESKKILNYFSSENSARWIFAKNTLGDKPASIYKTAYLTAINTIKEVLSSMDDSLSFSLETKDLSYLIFLAEKALEANNEERSEQIETVILRLIDSGRFGWFGVMNNDIVCQMFVLGNILKMNHSNEEIVNLVAQRAIKYEGWGVTPIASIKEKENTFGYLICAALQVVDEEENFRSLADLAINQYNGARMTSDALMAPLIMAELIVTQHNKNWRDWFEQKLLTEMESFEALINVLVQANSSMTEQNRVLFDKRKNEEWDYTCSQYSSTHRKIELNRLLNLMTQVENGVNQVNGDVN